MTAGDTGIKLFCPHCRAGLAALNFDGPATEMPCQCGQIYHWDGAIAHMIPPERRARLQPFLAHYTAVRKREGRMDWTAESWRALPRTAPDHRHAREWRIRAQSYAAFAGLLGRRSAGALVILDLGAGNGWLSQRLSRLGHRPVAVDIHPDDCDGLGAGRHFGATWPAIEAEYDALPLADDFADIAVFNGSLHYSAGLEGTIAEAVRVLRPGGTIVVMDSPIYRDPGSGEQMVAEMGRYFRHDLGLEPPQRSATGYLTWSMLAGLAGAHGAGLRIVRPFYGLRWALRPLLSRMRGSREPAAFAVIRLELPATQKPPTARPGV